MTGMWTRKGGGLPICRLRRVLQFLLLSHSPCLIALCPSGFDAEGAYILVATLDAKQHSLPVRASLSVLPSSKTTASRLECALLVIRLVVLLRPRASHSLLVQSEIMEVPPVHFRGHFFFILTLLRF